MHGDFFRFEIEKPRARPQFAQHVDARCILARRAHRFETHGTHLCAERLHRKSAAVHVPGIGRNEAARLDHARHLGNAFVRLRNEENHQRHRRHIEFVVGKRQRHRIAFMELRDGSAWPAARKTELRRRRIDAMHFGGRAPLDQQFGEGAVAATDIDKPQARRQSQPVEENVAGNPAPFSHHIFVGGAVFEADLFSHDRSFTPPPARRAA